MPTYTDHLHRSLHFAEPPKRFISLCPSVTETLWDMGAELVGRTRFCIHPQPHIRQVPVLGGTKELKHERIAPLRPDCIIAVKEENTPEMVAELEKEYPVVVFDVRTVADAFRLITDLGELTQKRENAQRLRSQIEASWQPLANIHRNKKVLYLIWKDPYMVVGADTYIDDVLTYLGYENMGRQFWGRYPELSPSQIQELQADYIFLSSEPYPFADKHIKELQACSPKSEIKLLDGELYSWYGSRMLKAASDLI